METRIKVILTILLVCSICSYADFDKAEPNAILLINGIDVSDEPKEIEGKGNFIITVSANITTGMSCSVVAETGYLEKVVSQDFLTENDSKSFIFKFDESILGVINLYINDVHVYQLILFYIAETNKTTVFGIDYKNLHFEPVASSSDVKEIAVEENEIFPAPEITYAEAKQKEREDNLKYCPAGTNETKEIFSKEVYELFSEEDGKGFALELDGVIEINSDITTNQIWSAANTYHVTSDVNVQALLVIEPGTIVYFSEYGSLYVNNGGTLISSGTPDNPIIYTSDTGNGWCDYYCAICVEQTASPTTKITYSYIDCAYIAIITDNIRLETPIQNNYLFYNSYGILEYGTEHTDIINNLVLYGFNNYYYSRRYKCVYGICGGIGRGAEPYSDTE